MKIFLTDRNTDFVKHPEIGDKFCGRDRHLLICYIPPGLGLVAICSKIVRKRGSIFSYAALAPCLLIQPGNKNLHDISNCVVKIKF